MFRPVDPQENYVNPLAPGDTMPELQKRIQQFMHTLPENRSGIWYFAPIFDLLIGLNLPLTAIYGFACMRLLETRTIIFSDGRIINDFADATAWGRISDIADAIAIVFAEVNSDPRWWTSRYPNDAGQPEVENALQDLNERLSSLPFIERFE